MKISMKIALPFFILILLSLVEASGFFSPALDLVKKALMIFFVCYLIYKVNLAKILFGFGENKLSKLLFGVNYKDINIVVVFAFFLIALKDILLYMISQNIMAARIFAVFTETLVIFERVSLSVGVLSLFLVSVFIALKFTSNRSSFVGFFHSKIKFVNIILTFFIIFLFLTACFLLLFNPLMHLIFLISLFPLLVISICAVILIYPPPYSFYNKVVDLFSNKKRVYLAVAGLFVFNLLVQFFSFVIPYFTESTDLLIFRNFDPFYHTSLSQLLIEDLMLGINAGNFALLAIIMTYFLNILCFLTLVIVPVVIWYKLVKRKDYNVNILLFCLFWASLMVFILRPIFRLKLIDAGKDLIGVNIIAHNIYSNNLLSIIMIALITGFLCYILAHNKIMKKALIGLSLVFVNAFIATYLIYYLISVFVSYSKMIAWAFIDSSYFISFILGIFLAVIMIFYLGGFVSFIAETVQEYKYIHLSKDF